MKEKIRQQQKIKSLPRENSSRYAVRVVRQTTLTIKEREKKEEEEFQYERKRVNIRTQCGA